MKATRYPVTARYKEIDLMIADRADFTVGAPEEIEARSIVENPCCTLYSLDLEGREACFVETPASFDLATAPFYFIAQYQQATHLVTVSFDTFHALAEELELDGERIAFVHSVGRCGSTLISKAFAAVSVVCSLSEPDTLTQLVIFRGLGRMEDVEVERFARDCIRFVCKPLAESEDCTFWAIKFRSQCLEICDLLSRAFPRAKNLYLTRDPESWLGSAYRAFVEPEWVGDKDRELEFEDIFAEMYALVRALRVPGKPMPIWKVWMLNWIANTENKQRLAASGIVFADTNFAEIKRDPEGVVRKLFTACGLEGVDWPAIRDVLARDSQAGSIVARSEVSDTSRFLPEQSRLDAVELLVARGHLSGA